MGWTEGLSLRPGRSPPLPEASPEPFMSAIRAHKGIAEQHLLAGREHTHRRLLAQITASIFCSLARKPEAMPCRPTRDRRKEKTREGKERKGGGDYYYFFTFLPFFFRWAGFAGFSLASSLMFQPRKYSSTGLSWHSKSQRLWKPKSIRRCRFSDKERRRSA